MKLGRLETIISKPNKITVILIILFVLTLLFGHERICALIYPAPLNQYRGIIGNITKDFRGQKLGIGHTINFQYKENKKSLGELYSLTDIKFIPENKTLSAWNGKDKPGTWNQNTAAMESMQRFRIRFATPVPDDKKLEGNTIKGTLHFELSYPVLIKFTEPKSIIRSETWDKPISVYIFSKIELDKLSKLTNQMVKIWMICLALFFFPILLIFVNHMRKQKKIHPPRVV
jgi:energy-converting hydrogenase Eha subunit F